MREHGATVPAGWQRERPVLRVIALPLADCTTGCRLPRRACHILNRHLQEARCAVRSGRIQRRSQEQPWDDPRRRQALRSPGRSADRWVRPTAGRARKPVPSRSRTHAGALERYGEPSSIMIICFASGLSWSCFPSSSARRVARGPSFGDGLAPQRTLSTSASFFVVESAQAEKAEDRENDHYQTDQIDDLVHGLPPRSMLSIQRRARCRTELRRASEINAPGDMSNRAARLPVP